MDSALWGLAVLGYTVAGFFFGGLAYALDDDATVGGMLVIGVAWPIMVPISVALRLGIAIGRKWRGRGHP